MILKKDSFKYGCIGKLKTFFDNLLEFGLQFGQQKNLYGFCLFNGTG